MNISVLQPWLSPLQLFRPDTEFGYIEKMAHNYWRYFRSRC